MCCQWGSLKGHGEIKEAIPSPLRALQLLPPAQLRPRQRAAMAAGAGGREGKLSLLDNTAQERGVQPAVLPRLAWESRTGRQRRWAPPWLTSLPDGLEVLLAAGLVLTAGSQAGLGGVPQKAAVGAWNQAKKPCPSVTLKCSAPQSPGSGLCAHAAKPESLHRRAEIPIFFLLSGSFPGDGLSLMAEINNCYCLIRTGLG